MTLWIVAILIAFFAWYVIKGRTWLKSKPWMDWYYRSAIGEWTELVLFKKSESVLWGRFLQAMGYGLSALASLGGIDLSPLAAVLPDHLQWLVSLAPLVISLAGHVQVQLRLDTTKPIELVAVTDKVEAEVAPALAQAEASKLEAVAVVEEAKKAA